MRLQAGEVAAQRIEVAARRRGNGKPGFLAPLPPPAKRNGVRVGPGFRKQSLDTQREQLGKPLDLRAIVRTLRPHNQWNQRLHGLGDRTAVNGRDLCGRSLAAKIGNDPRQGVRGPVCIRRSFRVADCRNDNPGDPFVPVFCHDTAPLPVPSVFPHRQLCRTVPPAAAEQQTRVASPRRNA